MRSITLFSCDDKVSREPRDCHVFLRDCHEVIFTWHPGTLGEVLPIDLLLDTDTLMLELVYNPGTGWLKDSSGLRLHHSPRVPDLARLGGRSVVVNRSEVICHIRYIRRTQVITVTLAISSQDTLCVSPQSSHH